jgi:hypothetical protein
MRITKIERDTLSGPLKIGIFTRLIAAICTLVISAKCSSAAQLGWATIFDALQSFVIFLLFSFIPFGVAPVLANRMNSQEKQHDREG